MKIIQMIIVGSMLAMLPSTVMAQRGSGNWCSNNNYSRLFNASTIEELTGSVVSIEKITPEQGMSTGIHLLVKTKKTKPFLFTSGRPGTLTIRISSLSQVM
ncbi:MAG: hypothetical protein IPL27_27175 [Lewinellaceae bacterium]|nr:hypothetical protein [Lewinellaceae bacterium]